MDKLDSHARFAQGESDLFAVLFGLLLLAAVAGCRPKTQGSATPELLAVPVAHPVRQLVTDYVNFPGRTDAVQSANIIARVTGYLVPVPKPKPDKQAVSSMQGGPNSQAAEGKQALGPQELATDLSGYAFKEGAEVKKGDLLFLVDPRPYNAQYEQAQSQVTVAETNLSLAQATLKRYQDLAKGHSGAVSPQEMDQYKATFDMAAAQLTAAKKSLEVYRLNKEFTEVRSPIDGQVSRYYLTLGNLVNQDQRS